MRRYKENSIILFFERVICFTLAVFALPNFCLAADAAPSSRLLDSQPTEIRKKFDEQTDKARAAFWQTSGELFQMAQARLGMARKMRKTLIFFGLEDWEGKAQWRGSGKTASAITEDQKTRWNPRYHHKGGFLPWRDSLIMGLNYREEFFANRMEVTAHPFVGQSWTSVNNIWGGEIGLTYRNENQKPVGRFALRYDDGAKDFTVADPGYDLHSDWQVNERTALTFGARDRADEEASGYAMLRWRWELGGTP